MTSGRKLDNAMKAIPNARKVADGWLIEGDGWTYHVFDMHSPEAIEGLTPAEHFYLPFCSRDEIFQMRKISSAADHLLWFRADAIAESPRFVRVFRKRAKGIKGWTLTSWYSRRNNARDVYVNSLTKGAQGKVQHIPAGLALIRDVNAMCMLTPHGNVIAVSEALEHFLYYMNLAFYGSELGLDGKDRQAALAIAVRTMLGTESLDFDLDPRGILPDSIHVPVLNLTTDQLSFTFGHEYSHHLLGHLSGAQTKQVALSDVLYAAESARTVQSYVYKHALEYEADWFAIKNVKSNTEYRSRLANAAFTMFIYFDVLSHVFMAMGHRSTAASTHPAPLDRVWKLRRRLNRKIGLPPDEIANLISHAAAIKEALVKEWVPYRFDELERYGSIYLPSYKGKLLVDRVDF